MANELLRVMAVQFGYEGREAELQAQLYEIVDGHGPDGFRPVTHTEPSVAAHEGPQQTKDDPEAA